MEWKGRREEGKKKEKTHESLTTERQEIGR